MAQTVESLLSEFREEVPATRRLLERVPTDKLGWKPHPKSRSLGELAMHVAGVMGMAERIANANEFSPSGAPPAPPATAEEILEVFERNVRASEEALGKLSEEAGKAEWRFIFRGKELFRKPRVAGLRTNVLNHLYHHRGQLSVYLRLLEVPVPVVYGPTADENPFA